MIHQITSVNLVLCHASKRSKHSVQPATVPPPFNDQQRGGVIGLSGAAWNSCLDKQFDFAARMDTDMMCRELFITIISESNLIEILSSDVFQGKKNVMVVVLLTDVH